MPVVNLKDKKGQSNTPDPALAEMVKRGILKAREKLIDLSQRNPMLNFKHLETSARHIRIIDQTLSSLVDDLTSGKKLDVVPLPPVDAVPSDEDTEDFRSALKAAKKTDEEWLAAEDALRAAGKRRFKDKVAERSLRDRVRNQLGMDAWKGSINAKLRAEELGINPSYDLPTEDRERAKDRKAEIQTLLFPERLDSKLSTVYGTARTLQEDAGINALFCAVGFLEWFETEDATNPAFAPLVLFPINMQKQAKAGEYIFTIEGRDEDESINVALIEKLKRHHAIALEDYDIHELCAHYAGDGSFVEYGYPHGYTVDDSVAGTAKSTDRYGGSDMPFGINDKRFGASRQNHFNL